LMIATHKEKLCRRGAEDAGGKTKIFSASSAPLRREKFLFLFFCKFPIGFLKKPHHCAQHSLRKNRHKAHLIKSFQHH
jgi:hypothetical protein